LELFKTLFDELKNNPYMREPIEHGDSLSDKEKIKTIITNAIKSVRNVGDRLEEELDMRKVV
ncbi:hypothetical protein ACSLPB_29780, partial [Escherichia coli]